MTNSDTKPNISKEYKLLTEQIKKYTRKKINPDSNLKSDLELDSISFLELHLFIETTFGINILEKKFHKLSTIEKLTDYIVKNKRLSKKSIINWKKLLKTDNPVKLPPHIWMFKLTDAWFRSVFMQKINLTSTGKINVPDGPCILAPNHASLIDPIIAYTCLKDEHKNDVYFLAKEKHFNNPILKLYAKNSHVIVMHTEKNLKESLQKIGKALIQDKKVMIFPEGTRSKTGKIHTFLPTFAHIAKEFNIPVIPVALKGVYEAVPYPKIFPKKGNISVHYLKPIYPEKLSETAILTRTLDSIINKLK